VTEVASSVVAAGCREAGRLGHAVVATQDVSSVCQFGPAATAESVPELHRTIPGDNPRRGHSARPELPSGLPDFDCLPLIFPAEVVAAR
jgi:hypothetical protein